MTGLGASARGLIFGGTGMLGQSVVRELRRRGGIALGLSHGQADISNPTIVDYWVESFRPQIVFNCAAFTRVDDCETQPDLAFRVNGAAVENIAAACRRADIPMVHISSDYVFDGTADKPYIESHSTGPTSVYGESKLAGEVAALGYDQSLVVRASWLFGPGGPNFVATMLRLIDSGMETLRVVDDQRGAPTYTPFLARALVDLGVQGAHGLVNYQNREDVTWFGFAREIVAQYRPSIEVQPVTTAEFPRPAARPAYSVLDLTLCEELLGRPVERWSYGLHEYLEARRSVADC